MSIFQGAYTMKNFYEELNITFDANEKTILNALHRIAQSGQYSLEQIQQIKETLLNPEKRAEYNLTLTQNKSKNFYEILNISPNASKNTILNAIRRKAQTGELSLKQIQAIKETLLNVEKKAEYDKTIVFDKNDEKIKTLPNFSISFYMLVSIILLSAISLFLYYYYQNVYPYRIKEGEKIFFTQRDKIMDYPDAEEMQINRKEYRMFVELISISQDNTGNIATLYQRRSNAQTYDELRKYYEREKHISLYNVKNSKDVNDKLRQKEEKINKFIGIDKTLSKVKLTNSGKLFVFGNLKTYIFDLNSDFVEEIPIGRAMFMNERYLAFDTNNVEITSFKGKIYQWCNKELKNSFEMNCNYDVYSRAGRIAFYDLISKEMSDITLPYDEKICGFISDFRKIAFDKKGDKVVLVCNEFARQKENKERLMDSKIQVYQIKKEKDIIVSADKVFEKDFNDLYIYKPQFSNNSKEIYFIQSNGYNFDSDEKDRFVRYDITKYSEIQSSIVDMHDILTYHYRPEYNDLFVVGSPYKKTLAMFSENNRPNVTNNPKIVSFYYHNFNYRHGYYDELNPAQVDRMNTPNFGSMCQGGFFFSKSGNTVMPICRDYLHVYFIRKGEERPKYFRDMLKEREEKRIL